MSEDGRIPGTGGDTDGLLTSYLAGQDAECPACGYNLRGVTSATCPECGASLRLGIQEAGTLGRRRGLLLLIFCWLLLAGGMNDFRVLRAIHQTITAPPQRLSFFQPTFTFPTTPSGVLPRTIVIDRGGVTVAPEPDVDGEAGASAVETETTIITRLTDDERPSDVGTDEPAPIDAARRRALAAISPLAGTVAAPNAAPSMQFSFSTLNAPTWRVHWSQWLGAAWWSAMVLAALVGLTLLAIHHRRPASRAVARTLMVIAWCAFTGYFGYHLLSFVRELT